MTRHRSNTPHGCDPPTTAQGVFTNDHVLRTLGPVTLDKK
jgi:hypothetical protein